MLQTEIFSEKNFVLENIYHFDISSKTTSFSFAYNYRSQPKVGQMNNVFVFFFIFQLNKKWLIASSLSV